MALGILAISYSVLGARKTLIAYNMLAFTAGGILSALVMPLWDGFSQILLMIAGREPDKTDKNEEPSHTEIYFHAASQGIIGGTMGYLAGVSTWAIASRIVNFSLEHGPGVLNFLWKHRAKLIRP